MNFLRSSLSLIFLFASAWLTACSDSPDRVRTSCGAVNSDGELVNPVDRDQGEPIIITSFSRGNLVTVRERDSKDLLLVVLHGLAEVTDPFLVQQAEEFIFSETSDGVFFPATEGCTIDSDTLTELLPGQIFFEDGRSLSEELLAMGLAHTTEDDDCDSERIRNCFQGIELESSFDNAGEES
ncbi:MAG: hypothetical protein KDD60_04035 [Bdellovibrionales bacterium]|nr:hypothetical protein [Bdellovibrionales bacterium]